MQRCARKQHPEQIIITAASALMSCANQLLVQSSLLFQVVGRTPACMSSSSRNWHLPEGRQHPFNQQQPESWHGAGYSSTHSQVQQQSAPEGSPYTQYPVGYTAMQSPSREHIRRRDTRSGMNTLRHRQMEPQLYNNSAESHQSYIAFAPQYSDPSLFTTFPEYQPRTAVRSTPSWPPLSSPLSRHQSYPPSMFSPVNNDPQDSWSPQRSHSQSYISSPTSYTGPQFSEPANYGPHNPHGHSASSAPGAMQSPLRSSNLDPYNNRRESEQVDFTSPSEFALFAEATSSLNINATTASPWSRTRAPPTASRLAAPLPPLPRSHSSPASYTRSPGEQLSRTQLLAEALVGVDGEGTQPGLDDDELPDYEQSQAEASARQRREAARRAQELDQLWSEARRRRG